MKKITSLNYGNDFDSQNELRVGKFGVAKIEEHAAAGDGDKWYYDVFYIGGKVSRFFSFSKIDFEEKNEF